MVHPPQTQSPSPQLRPGIRARLWHRGAFQWYAGTIFGLAYQVIEIVNVWTNHRTLGQEIGGTILLTVFYAGYVVLPPLVWPQSVRFRVVAIMAYWLATLILWPFIGVDVIWIWPLIGAMIAFCWLPLIPSFVLAGSIVAAQFVAAWATNFVDATLVAPFITLTVLISLFAIARQIVANQQLKDAQATIATLAAAEERARLARDLHDVLGHSLTVVAVKSELAGRLVDLDPKLARAEIADIEALARTALADLRAAVTTYREMSLDAELSAARTALDAAGIRSHLPENGKVVADELRALFGWVVPEGVTNVIRHSEAAECWIAVEQNLVRIRDDGRGKNTSGGGNGLRGLRERAHEAGAEVTADRSTEGGFVLTVQKALT